MTKTRYRNWFTTNFSLILVIVVFIGLPRGTAAAPLLQLDAQAEADALWEEGQILFQDGQLQAALSKFEAALPLYQQSGDRNREAFCRFAISVVRHRLTDYAGALEAYQDALALWQEIGEKSIIGTIQNNMGEIHSALGHDEVALLNYQEALAIFIEIDDRAGEGTVRNNMGLAYDELGRYEEALEMYQEGLAIAVEREDLLAEAAIHNNIGGVYDNLGRYEEALAAYKEALPILTAIGHRPGEGAAYIGIGAVYSKLGRYQDALIAFQEALTIMLAMGNPVGETAARVNIAAVYTNLGRYQEALSTYQTILANIKKTEDPKGSRTARNNIGLIYNKLGQYEEALAVYQEVLSDTVEIGDSVGEAITQSNIGSVYTNQGRYQKALTAYQKALAIQVELGDRAGEETTLGNIGTVHTAIGRQAEAESYYQKALAIARDIGDRAGEAVALSNIGGFYLKEGYYEKALAAYQDVLTIQEEIGDRAGEGTTRNNIGTLYEEMGRFEDALITYQDALTLRTEIGDRTGEGITYSNIGSVYNNLGRDEEAMAAHQTALKIATEIGDRVGSGIALGSIGYIHEKQGHLREAIDYYQQSIEFTAAIQNDIQIEELKAAFAGGQIKVYERLVHLLWENGQHGDVFAYIQRAGAQAFLDSIGNQQIDFRKNTAPELIEQEQALRRQITGLKHALNNERATAVDQQSQTLREIQSALEQARNEYEELIIRLKLVNPEYASLVSVNILTLEEIQQQILDEQTTVVQYFMMDEQTLVLIVDQDNFKVISLDVPRRDVTSQVQFLRNLIADSDFDTDVASELWGMLFAPLQPYIEHPNLIIVPHGVLHYLPFAALWDAAANRYLVEEYAITYAPSASALRFILDKRNPDEGHLLALGNPDQTLGNAAIEARNVAQLYGATPLLRSRATESQLQQQAGQTDILHLAAHGVYDPFNPLFTRIELAADEEELYDGNLEVHEVYSMDLTSANLVVLSACQTALGEQSAGDEIVGLTRAFLYAGAPSVITSLWNVDDESTAYLMTQFYTHYRDSMGVAAALRQAQLDTMAEYPEPYHWAAFTLHGDGGWAADHPPVVEPATDQLAQPAINVPLLNWLYERVEQLELE